MNSGATLWHLDIWTRMCKCGADRVPPSPTLRVYTDGRRRYAHCEECGKTWDVDTGKEMEK